MKTKIVFSIAMITVVGFILYLYTVSTGLTSSGFFGTTVNNDNFNSRSEMASFLDEHTPFQIPDDASDIEFTAVFHMDWNMRLKFSLPKNRIADFTTQLLKTKGVKLFKFESTTTVTDNVTTVILDNDFPDMEWLPKNIDGIKYRADCTNSSDGIAGGIIIDTLNGKIYCQLSNNPFPRGPIFPDKQSD